MQQVVWVVAALVALLYPIPFERNGQIYYETVGFLVLLNAMLGIGWNIIGGWAGQFDFGPSIFFAIGAYTAALLSIHWGFNAWLALAGAVVVSVVICAAVTYPVTRLRGHYFAIATVAMWMIAQPIGATWSLINGSQGLFIPVAAGGSFVHGMLTMEFPGRGKGLGFYYLSLLLFVATLLGARAIERSKWGFYFRAVRDDQDGAEAIGIDSRLYKVIARCLMAAIFAAGGTLYGFWALAVFPDQVLEVNWNILPMMAAVVGGLGRLWGRALGAIVLIPISQLMTATLGAGPLAGRGIDLIIYGAVIMLIAGWRPNGLLSTAVGRVGRPRARARARGEPLTAMAPLLQIERCTKRFGGLVANRDVSLTIESREIVGLIGPNGAGKTTLFSCISGSLHPDEGRIVLDGVDISRARPERVCRLGIARTWQVVRSFGRMTVLENVICGALRRTSRIGPARARALELLAFTGLAGKEDVVAAALTLADKKRLEITRALATSPRLLLLDEAMSGLTPFETTAAVDLVRRIHSRACTSPSAWSST